MPQVTTVDDLFGTHTVAIDGIMGSQQPTALTSGKKATPTTWGTAPWRNWRPRLC